MTRALTQRVRRLERLLTPQGDPLDDVSDDDLAELIRLIGITLSHNERDAPEKAWQEAFEGLQRMFVRYPRLHLACPDISRSAQGSAIALGQA